MSCVVLLSGGLDSAVALAEYIYRGHVCLPLLIDYGQRHREELLFARKLCRYYKLKSTTLKVTLPAASALLSTKVELEKDRSTEEISGSVPSSYVGCRNAIFLAMAGSFAESEEADTIVTGFNFNDAMGFPMPDGRFEFLKAMELALMLGSRCGALGQPLKLSAPLITMSKKHIVERAKKLGVPMHLTRSCFEDTEGPCGRCDACRVRAEAFKNAGLRDPLLL